MCTLLHHNNGAIGFANPINGKIVGVHSNIRSLSWYTHAVRTVSKSPVRAYVPCLYVRQVDIIILSYKIIFDIFADRKRRTIKRTITYIIYIITATVNMTYARFDIQL